MRAGRFLRGLLVGFLLIGAYLRARLARRLLPRDELVARILVDGAVVGIEQVLGPPFSPARQEGDG